MLQRFLIDETVSPTQALEVPDHQTCPTDARRGIRALICVGIVVLLMGGIMVPAGTAQVPGFGDQYSRLLQLRRQFSRLYNSDRPAGVDRERWRDMHRGLIQAIREQEAFLKLNHRPLPNEPGYVQGDGLESHRTGDPFRDENADRDDYNDFGKFSGPPQHGSSGSSSGNGGRRPVVNGSGFGTSPGQGQTTWGGGNNSGNRGARGKGSGSNQGSGSNHGGNGNSNGQGSRSTGESQHGTAGNRDSRDSSSSGSGSGSSGSGSSGGGDTTGNGRPAGDGSGSRRGDSPFQGQPGGGLADVEWRADGNDLPNDPDMGRSGKSRGDDLGARRPRQGAPDNRSGIQQLHGKDVRIGRTKTGADDKERPDFGGRSGTAGQRNANPGNPDNDLRYGQNGTGGAKVQGGMDRAWWSLNRPRAQPGK